MASRQFRSGISFGSLVPNMRVLTGVLDGTSDGYGEIVEFAFNGVASVEWLSTGLYKLKLQDKYVSLVSVQLTPESKTVLMIPTVYETDVTGADPYVTIQVIDASNSPIDIGNADKVHVTLVLRDSTVKV